MENIIKGLEELVKEELIEFIDVYNNEKDYDKVELIKEIKEEHVRDILLEINDDLFALVDEGIDTIAQKIKNGEL